MSAGENLNADMNADMNGEMSAHLNGENLHDDADKMAGEKCEKNDSVVNHDGSICNENTVTTI